MEPVTFALIFFGAVLLVILFIYAIYIFNVFIILKNNINKSLANIEVLLKQRNDELPQLVKTIKAYMSYEKKLIIKILEARKELLKAESLKQKAHADSEISKALKSIFALAENYPHLMASKHFYHLQKRITGIENELADRREFYNESVTRFNINIEVIPYNMIAKLLNYKKYELFKAS